MAPKGVLLFLQRLPWLWKVFCQAPIMCVPTTTISSLVRE